MCLLHDNVKSIVESIWYCPVSNDLILQDMAKLKADKSAFCLWNKNVFRDVNLQLEKVYPAVQKA